MKIKTRNFFLSFVSKIRSPKQKILITVLYISVVTLMYILNGQCIFISLFNISCPGCGMTRALISALSLDFKSAFSYHMMFWSLPLIYLYFLFDGKLFRNRKADIIIWVVLTVGFLVNWIVHMIW